MNTKAIFAIIRRDLMIASKNKVVILSTIVLTIVFFVVFPWLVAFIPLLGNSIEGLEKILKYVPADLLKDFAGLSMTQTITVYVLKYMLAPFFLMLPLMVASTIAADSFAGEKERKTMEALLYTPTTDRELFVAKLLSGWIAALVIGLVGFFLYIVMANAAAWPQMHRIFFPDVMWAILILWVVPAIAGLGVAVMVLASARAQSFQDANQAGGIVVLPLIALFYAQIAGVIYFNIIVVFLIGTVIWVLTGLLIWFGSRGFKRNQILTA
jgi:ABC-type transport system involved in multi-copper enzyme maturation permease subunit